MIADLKPYAEYKESGLPWLGELPAHWDMRRAKYFLREVDERSQTGKEVLLSVSHLTGVTPRSEKTITMFLAKSNVGHKMCRPDDVVINTLWAWMAALGVTKHAGIVSPAYGVYRPFETNRLLPQFVDQLLRTPRYAAEYLRRSTGVNSSRMRLYAEQFLRIPLVCPPPAEQAAIVRFLDWANGRLERAIRAKRRVIALLNEQKQAIIHRAVTRGLDPSVPLKPSGIPWLGDIPQHWEVRRLKHCVSPIEQGWSPQCDAQPAGENEWGVLKVGCVNKDSFSPQQNKRLPSSLQPDHRLEIRDGDVLVSRANTRELLGLAAVAEHPPAKRMLCDKLFRFRARGDCFNSKFLVLTLRAKPSRVQIESSTNGASSSMQNIGQGVLKNLWVAAPSVAEQDMIVTHIAVATQPLRAAISRLEREIELLREYRTRLVADVVTGKLDVRDAAARLPEQPDESDALDETDSQPELDEDSNGADVAAASGEA
jgi:type I restriction enzyme S subunit